jgi:hypothetical protein
MKLVVLRLPVCHKIEFFVGAPKDFQVATCFRVNSYIEWTEFGVWNNLPSAANWTFWLRRTTDDGYLPPMALTRTSRRRADTLGATGSNIKRGSRNALLLSKNATRLEASRAVATWCPSPAAFLQVSVVAWYGVPTPVSIRVK